MKITLKVIDKINKMYQTMTVEQIAKKLKLKPETIRRNLLNNSDSGVLAESSVSLPRPNRIIRRTTEILFEDGSTQVDVLSYSLKGD